ncbi:glycoside hydrolase 43 family protein [Mucilaginibacter sp. RS28]|uniref:Glycoside hydrolase 43 family protein n=1 Tax=Mucilaginibacter straminoryzae TaxID=2932774 RepID=A0A9X1X0K3_9SPHI|nr:glycoside hydrolase 43 family protein [Mucilaginibacter straminoryzae]MCJ8208416.1 glycoside hydrolase 43 family protein [Mucilaginibacter straminoryzae]
MHLKKAIWSLSVFLLAVVNVYSQPQQTPVTWGNWLTWGDQGNGTYHNPVLPGDYSDVDCIRVGTDYYAVSSTFQYSPGFVVLHSKDLVNWKILGHVVNDISVISPAMNYTQMDRYGKGIWAGAIRYHDHRFWVYFCDPDEGYLMSTAEKPEGPWSPLKRVLAEKGWDDCCPFWDENGQGYLVGTNFADNYKIHLFKMTADGQSLIKASDKVIYQSNGSEANKLYQINRYYYHLFSEVRNNVRVLMMERAKNIWGPYEGPRQLSEGQPQYNEPNQGGLVKTPSGNWYFLTHHGSGDWSGRILSLLPVTWLEGWPIIGKPNAAGIGEMVWSAPKPVANQQKVIPQSSDDFSSATLQPQWEWNYQPRKDKWSLTERKGWLRLHAFNPLKDNLLYAGNTLTQRTYRTERNEVTVKFDISGMTDGQKAGFAHFGNPNYSAVGIVCIGKLKRLEFTTKDQVIPGPQINGKLLWLRSVWGLNGQSTYSYSTDGKVFEPIGEVYQLQWGSYRGDRLAIYNYNAKADNGYVDVDYLHYTYAK